MITLDLPENTHELVSFEGYRYSITLLDPNTIRDEPPSINLPGRSFSREPT